MLTAAVPVTPDPKPFIEHFLHSPYESGGFEYAWVSRTGYQLNTWSTCRDYTQDTLWAALNGVKSYHFGRSNAPVAPLDSRHTRLGIRCNRATAERALGLLHALEPDFGMRLTRIHYGGKIYQNSVWVFEGDRQWMFAPPLLSLYTLALRAGRTYDGSSWQKFFERMPGVLVKDISYVRTALPAIEFLVGKDFGKIFASTKRQNYPGRCSSSETHSYSGIYAMGNRSIAKSVSKHWADQQWSKNNKIY